jgi:3-isopropylmalate/(R)-2-methylmalate dehydratase small subunit
VTRLFQEGQVARVDYESGRVTNVTTGATLDGTPLPQLLIDIVHAGGVIPMLIREDFIEPAPHYSPTE